VAGTSGFAIAAFVLGLLGVVLPSVIFGIMALVRLPSRPQRGKGLAIAGLCLSGLWVAALIALIALVAHTASTAAQRSASGQIISNGHTDVLSLRTGDCFQSPTGDQSAADINQLTAVTCATPHNAQVIAQVTPLASDYPTEASFHAQEAASCRASLKVDVNPLYLSSKMHLRFVYPDEQDWSDGKRTVSCVVVNPTSDLTFSLLASP